MNLLDQDEELLKIVEQAKALREECMKFNRCHDYQVHIVNLYNCEWAFDPVRLNINNMPKDDTKVVDYQGDKHYYYRQGDVEFYDVVSGGRKNG